MREVFLLRYCRDVKLTEVMGREGEESHFWCLTPLELVLLET